MKRFLIAIMLISASIGKSQAANLPMDKTGTVTGIVFDKNLQEAIPYASVVIKNLSDEIITGGITDEDGSFNIKEIPEGKYKVELQFIGYKTYDTNIEITKQQNKIDLGRIELEENVASLDEVTITAERTTIEQKIDRKVINIGKDLTTAGPTASDIMNNLPSVSLDQQTGNISLRGNENVQVMVDGKLSTVPVAQLLKQIPTTSIKQIELITNPSAKYNPEGMSGIINIILHKNTTIGFNGNVSVGLTYEEQAKFNSALDMNYRNGKFNFYGNIGNNVAKNENFGRIFRADDNSEQFFNFSNNIKSNLFKVGLDIYINEKNTFSFFTNQNIFDGSAGGTVRIVYNDDMSLNQVQNIRNKNDNTTSQYNLNYKLDLNKEGHTIELEADYNDFNQEESADYIYTGNTTTGDFIEFIDTERNSLIANLDYTNPLSENKKLELGLEARLFETDLGYDANGLTLNESGELIPIPSTDFNFTRDIYSAYANYNKKFDKWGVQLGARIEDVSVLADTSGVRSFENKYFQLYPSAFVTYTPSEKNQYQISYSRRVDRPGVGQINPVREFATPLISSFGNPNLLPQFTNSIELNYTRSFEKGSITSGIFYRAISGQISRAVLVDRTNFDRVILSFDNFDDTSSYGFELSSNYKPTKWWNFNTSFDMYSQTQTGIIENLDRTVENPTVADIVQETNEVQNTVWNFRIFNNFKVSQKLSFSLFGLYRGENESIQFISEPMYFVNIGSRYSLWDGRGTFSFNYNDIFDTMESAFFGDKPYRQRGAFNWESNTWNVSLSYRFGGGNYRAKSRKKRDNRETNAGGIMG